MRLVVVSRSDTHLLQYCLSIRNLYRSRSLKLLFLLIKVFFVPDLQQSDPKYLPNRPCCQETLFADTVLQGIADILSAYKLPTKVHIY